MSKETYRFLLRMPAELREGLRREADSNGRSLNGEIVARLEGSLTAPPRRLSRDGAVLAVLCALSLFPAAVAAWAVRHEQTLDPAIAHHADGLPATAGLKWALVGEPATAR